MVTMRDVADLAGVSITTVSHVVNGTRPIRPETERRVREAIERTGYTGNAIARSLATGGTHSLGLAVPFAATSRLAELVSAVEDAAAAAGYPLVLADTHDTADAERRAVSALRSRQVDGLLLVPSSDTAGGMPTELRRGGLPTVLLDRMPAAASVDAVGPENVHATSSLVGHLAELGHTRIGMIASPTDHTTSAERVLGYRLGLGRAGLTWDPAVVAGGDVSREAAGAAVRRMLLAPRPVTAVIAGDSSLLPDVLRGARAVGAAVGGDVALVGYGDVEWADLVDPPVTALEQPVAETGRAAVSMLLERLADPEAELRAVRLAPVLRHRRSCGCGPS